MRYLNKQQQKFLTKLYEEKRVTACEDMSTSDFNKLFDMNPHETLYQNANRFLWDLSWEDVYK